MGYLRKFDIERIKNEYRLEAFVETGTGMGESVKFASQYFDKCYTCEIDNETFKKTAKINGVIQYSCNSVYFLKNIINHHIGTYRCLFWLDAHFPGSIVSGVFYNERKNKDITLPLEKELQTIVEFKNVLNDYFLIDDLRIYEDGEFYSGNWKNRKKYGEDGIIFIYQLLKKTHNITKNYQDEGYVICKPKKQ